MSSIVKLTQRLADLSQRLTQHGLTEDQKDEILDQIEDIEREIDEFYNPEDNDDAL